MLLAKNGGSADDDEEEDEEDEDAMVKEMVTFCWCLLGEMSSQCSVTVVVGGLCMMVCGWGVTVKESDRERARAGGVGTFNGFEFELDAFPFVQSKLMFLFYFRDRDTLRSASDWILRTALPIYHEIDLRSR